MSWIYEAITHAVTRPVVLRNEPSNVRGRGIRQGSTIATLCKIQSFAGRKLDQSNAMLVRILNGAVLKRSCGKQHCFLGAKRHLFGVQHLYLLTLNMVLVVLAFHKNEKVRTEYFEPSRYVDLISTILAVHGLPVYRLKILEFTGG